MTLYPYISVAGRIETGHLHGVLEEISAQFSHERHLLPESIKPKDIEGGLRIPSLGFPDYDVVVTFPMDYKHLGPSALVCYADFKVVERYVPLRNREIKPVYLGFLNVFNHLAGEIDVPAVMEDNMSGPGSKVVPIKTHKINLPKGLKLRKPILDSV